ncbi:hypothetical protein KIMH_09110 [Bombiscardovia apis]|uniref:RecX first three-helical domain-containing protein n=1 Tax=Bombiscardovia apis TaxID=2932182 RepID=A0ABM8BD17_9BIFI|nr:regulatory protein RecX [Bombiscardovia apis]BDR54800.1 hypothetical protein KIMH_09110 [Bombiscardovia apis]
MIEASTFLKVHPARIEQDGGTPDNVASAHQVKQLRVYDQAADDGQDHIEAAPQSQSSGVLSLGSFGQLPRENDKSKSRRFKSKRRRNRQAKQGGFGFRGGNSAGTGPKDPFDEDACKEAGLTLLDAAARPRQALVERLLAKGYDAAVVERAVDRLEELGLVDDQAYAESYLRYCLSRNLGERGSLMEMTRKGVSQPVAAAVVGQAARSGLFVDSAYSLGRAVAKKTQGLDQQVRKRRFWSAGGRKGHNPALLQEVAAQVFTDVETEEM